MLRDSAYLQERDVEWVNKRREKKKQAPLEPLYTMDDVEKAMSQFVGMQYNRTFELFPELMLLFRMLDIFLAPHLFYLRLKKKMVKKIDWDLLAILEDRKCQLSVCQMFYGTLMR